MPPPMKPNKKEHSHPGGTGAALGTHLARFSSMQGLSLLLTNILHFGSIAVVARFLGPKPLGAYALLFFLTGLITQIIHLISKPGTMMRTFGISDDDDDDVEDSEEKEAEETASTRPAYTLGVGIIWCASLAIGVIGIVFLFRTQIASFLLHDPSQADAVVFATITGGVWALFKLDEMVIWFENRPLTYALIDAARPAFNLIAIIVILAGGAGVKGAIIGQTIGTTTATVISVALIWKSFQTAFSFAELKQILKRGAIRIPIASSMWMVQNADSFILSRFLDHKSIGLYNLASRTGFMVAFLPQGFRMSLRPIRKTAVYQAYREEYGIPTANGQLLAYFVLITLTAILAMVLGGEILIQIGGPKFASAAPIIPLTAAAMSMPALYRSVTSMANYPYKRPVFVGSTIFVALCYIALMLLLLGHTSIGIYAAPIALLISFMIPNIVIFAWSQLGEKPIEFPYRKMLEATLVAVVIAVGFHFFHPAGEWTKLPVIAILMLVWFAALFALRIIPTYHWQPIRHIVMSALRRGSALRFDPYAGLGSLKRPERNALRTAVIERLPPATLVPSGGNGAQPRDGDEEEDTSESDSDRAAEGARLVRLLRRTGRRGGVPISEESELDAGISLFLFSDQPVAVRLRKMRQLLSAGADAHELRTLEDLRDDLSKVSTEIWGAPRKAAKQAANGRRRSGNGRRRLGEAASGDGKAAGEDGESVGDGDGGAAGEDGEAPGDGDGRRSREPVKRA
ncbi:MAG TPA: lipopolysaccharide biosynthesis protein [Solirubrobacterales bacterium]|nr:lipopolysaccharide biosynthesis protein [Solirubrobacterales bacterium]